MSTEEDKKGNEAIKKMIDAPGRYRITIRRGEAAAPGVDVEVDAFILGTKNYATGQATGHGSAIPCPTPQQGIKVFMEMGECCIKAAAAIASDIAAHADIKLDTPASMAPLGELIHKNPSRGHGTSN